MARVRQDQQLLPSVLDRLLDDQPEVTVEPPPSRYQVMRQLKQSVRRDLEALLNSRQRCISPPPHLKELKHSLLNYGVPDLSAANAGSQREREDLAKTLQAIISRNEPRFKSVKVSLLTNTEPLDRTFRFRIDAMLIADPAPEPVVFDSTMQAATYAFVVRGGDDE
jgi:type VI secretion system protein ImpF